MEPNQTSRAPAAVPQHPLSLVGSHDPWAGSDRTALDGGALATQTQCSSSGGGNGRCGGKRIPRESR